MIMQIVSFLIDHYNYILSVPVELTTAVNEQLTASTRTQVSTRTLLLSCPIVTTKPISLVLPNNRSTLLPYSTF